MGKTVNFTIALNVNGKDKVTGATTGIEQLEQAVKEVQTSVKGSLDSFNDYGFALQGVQNAVSQLSGALNDLTAESRSFGGAMAAANTMADKSGEDFDKLKGQVADLAKEVPIARDALANGLYQVVSNGVPEDNWIEFLRKSAKSSVGGIADLEEVVKVTSTVIKNYGLAWSDAGEIQDKIQLTAKNGVTSFEQMAQALPRVTANAATLGVTVDELMASFATLTGVSGNTAEVSTQLAAIFTALIKPSSEAAQMAQQMGIQFDAAAIKAAGGMNNFLSSLSQSVKQYAAASGMLEQEIYGKLFGSAESLRALTPLVGNLADKYKENVEAMQGSTGEMDNAFDKMANTGAAALQLLKNKLAGIADTLNTVVGPALPILNITTQMGMSVMAVRTLAQGITALATTTGVARIATIAWNATTVRMSALTTVCSASMRGAAVSATTLKLAIQGLMIATGVGIAVAALTGLISMFSSTCDSAGASAAGMASAERQAADNVKSAYDSTLKQTYSSLVSQYEQLKSSYLALKSTHEKTEWIKKNKGAFDELRIKVTNISDAENVFMKDTTAVAQAFERRAKAAAYAAQLVELYKQQLELANRKKDVDKAIQNVKRAYNNDTSIKNLDNPYAAQQRDRDAALAAIGVDMKNGGDGNIQKLGEQLDTVNKKIAETKQAMSELGEDKVIGGAPAGNASPKTTTPKTTTPKTTSPKSTTSSSSDPVKGSIAWYEQAIDKKKQELNNTADEATAKILNTQISGLEQRLNMLKIRLGVESVPPVEVDKEAESVIDRINAKIEGLKVNPIKIDVKGVKELENLERLKDIQNVDLSSFEQVQRSLVSIKSITGPTTQGLAAAGASCQALGQSMQQLGADSAAAKVGLIMAALGQIALSFAQALQSAASAGWIAWLAFGIAGTAQMISMISTISQFATGGIVGGNETSGDKVLVRVNSGEMILNAAQQARLFAIADGTAGVRANTATLTGMNLSDAQGGTRLVGKVRGRDIVLAAANETRSRSRRSNIRI